MVSLLLPYCNAHFIILFVNLCNRSIKLLLLLNYKKILRCDFILKQIGCRFWDLALREHASTNKVHVIFVMGNDEGNVAGDYALINSNLQHPPPSRDSVCNKNL